MRRVRVLAALAGIGLALVPPAAARNTRYMLPIETAMSTPEAQGRLDRHVRLFFGDQPHPAVRERLGEYVANRKTNAFNKSDREACEWVFLSVVRALQGRARQLGGDALVNIESYYRKVPVRSETEYECHAGATIAGVALRGEIVRLAEP